MSNNKYDIKQAMKDYYAHKSLSYKQLDSLQNKLKKQDVSNNSIFPDSFSDSFSASLYKVDAFKWLGSIAASVLFFVLILNFLPTPNIITTAFVDIHKDESLDNGMQISLQQWLDDNNIASVPQQYPVEMSKFCRLDQFKTTHLRIAGSKQGVLNVFFHRGDKSLYWRNDSGTVNGQHWKLVKVRDDLTLIVIYNDDMREESVQKILKGMLPELVV